MAILPYAPRTAPIRHFIVSDIDVSDVYGWQPVHQRIRQGRRSGRSTLVQALDLAPAPRRAYDLGERMAPQPAMGRHHIAVAWPTLPPPVVQNAGAFIEALSVDGILEPHRLREQWKESRGEREACYDEYEHQRTSAFGTPAAAHPKTLAEKLLTLERMQREERIRFADAPYQLSPDGTQYGYNCATIYVPKEDIRLVLREQVGSRAGLLRSTEGQAQAPLVHLGHLIDGDRTQQACVYSYWHELSSTLHCGDRACPQMGDEYTPFARDLLEFELHAGLRSRTLFSPLRIIRDQCATHVVMPLAHGTLAQTSWMLEQQRLTRPLAYSPRDAQLFCEQAAAGLLFNLKHLHAGDAEFPEGLCHGDVHPDNVLVSVGPTGIDVQLGRFGYVHPPRSEVFMSGTLDWPSPASYITWYFNGRRDDCFRLGRLLVTMAHPGSAGVLMPTQSYQEIEQDLSVELQQFAHARLRHNDLVARSLTAVLAAVRDFRWALCDPDEPLAGVGARRRAMRHLASEPLVPGRRTRSAPRAEFVEQQLQSFEQALDALAPLTGSNLERLVLALIEPRAEQMLKASDAWQIFLEGHDFADSFCRRTPNFFNELATNDIAHLPHPARVALREMQRRKDAANAQLADFARTLTGFQNENPIWALAHWEQEMGLLRVQTETYMP